MAETDACPLGRLCQRPRPRGVGEEGRNGPTPQPQTRARPLNQMPRWGLLLRLAHNPDEVETSYLGVGLALNPMSLTDRRKSYGGGIRLAPACSIFTVPRLGGLGPGATSETTPVWKFITNTSLSVPLSAYQVTISCLFPTGIAT
jgi:hypothetical protein